MFPKEHCNYEIIYANKEKKYPSSDVSNDGCPISTKRVNTKKLTTLATTKKTQDEAMSNNTSGMKHD